MPQQKIKVKTPEQALQTLEWLCSKMERCAQDARRSLYRWGVTSKAAQDEIIEKLQQNKFIDHRRYADIYVRDKVVAGRWGEAKIRMGLKAKGIEPHLIEDAIAENLSPKDTHEKLKKAILAHYEKEKKRTTDSYALKGKLFRRAVSRGFSTDEVKQIIETIF